MTPPTALSLPQGVTVRGAVQADTGAILTSDALTFIAGLARAFESRRQELLQARVERQQRIDAGESPDFLSDTKDIRTSDWKVAPLPDDLVGRCVEITGPVDRKMVINALNSGADVFMADFEDSNAPTWANTIEGQVNLRDAVRRTIQFTHPTTGKEYALNDTTATLVVRPRGWHLDEKHVTVDGQPVSASLFDFGLYFFHNAREALARGTGPYFYLPKLESHLEARLWNDVFVHAQNELGIPQGTIKATVLIETILAAFEMHEILYELREHSSGLNCGRWDYIFSFIKKFRNRADCVLPDRGLVGMDRRFLRSYSELVIQTCHRRGVHAMGGMAAQIPIKNDDEKNAAALDKVRTDKTREAQNGHDGTWVAHPALVGIAREAFEREMSGPHQLAKLREDVAVSADDLLAVPEGPITEGGLRQNVSIGIQYLAAWLSGTGCVPLYHLMEDAATAEISRAQVWQWIRHAAQLDDGRTVDAALVRGIVEEEMEAIRTEVGDDRFATGRYELARSLFEEMSTSQEFEDFLTLPAYDKITTLGDA